MKKFFLVIAAGLIIFQFLPILNGVVSLGKALEPIWFAILFGMIFSVPVAFLERTVFLKVKRGKRFFALTVVLLFFGAIAALSVWAVLPEAQKSVGSLLEGEAPFSAEEILAFLPEGNLKARLAEILRKQLPALLQSGLKKLTETAVWKNVLERTWNLFFGLILAIFGVANGKALSGFFKRVTELAVPKKYAESVWKIFAVAGEKFSRFLGGQCVEAIVFGLVCYGVFSLAKLPFAALSAVLLAIGNLVPVVGAYIGGGLAFLAVMSVSPVKALLFLVLTLALQQAEQFTTYPLVVGRYVGLNSFWILFAVVAGGALFGFWGLVLGVPATAFVYETVVALWAVRKRKSEEPRAISSS